MSASIIAYLDPGTGSVILQLLVGGVAALGVTARLWWSRVTSFFRRDRADEPAQAEHEPTA